MSNFADQFGGLLSQGLNAWEKVEGIKAIKNQTGQTLQEQKNTIALDNGVSMPVSTQPLTPGQQQNKAMLDKASEALGVTKQALGFGIVAVGAWWFFAGRG